MGRVAPPLRPWPPPRDLKLIQPRGYEPLAQRTTELRRMLTALMQKLIADR